MMKPAQNEELSAEERDRRVLQLYEQLVEIEQRLIPTGLHIFGRVGESQQQADTLRIIASFNRPELGAQSLLDLIAQGVGGSDYDSIKANDGNLQLREEIDKLLSAAIELFLAQGIEPATKFLQDEGKVKPEKSLPMFQLLNQVASELKSNQEVDSLIRALGGEYIPAGPGADIVQNPQILPTGRNTHAINPYHVPSASAFSRAEGVANSLLDRYRKEHGRYPRAMALVLWGLDNIKTQGEGVAQALWLLGVRPTRDSLNRATGVEPIPLEALQRPRIDVVMTVSGIFRDLFSPTMQLLDKAVRLVAELDEPAELNYVRRNVIEQIATDNSSFDEAVLRVFSNAPGNYGTNVNFMVMDSQWDQERTLGDLFVTRKCFAYGRNSQGESIDGTEARESMDRALTRVEATYQNIDTFEIGITDVDHYFEYLGGISKAVETRAHSKPSIYLADTLSRDIRVRTLEETVRLETRAKTLNPKWFEGMLKHGFRGVAEIENHLANTFGWSATAGAVDDWIYNEVAKTFLMDEAMLDRLRSLNPHSAHSLVGRLLEAEVRGYWEADEALLGKLREISTSLEDQLEGVI